MLKFTNKYQWQLWRSMSINITEHPWLLSICLCGGISGPNCCCGLSLTTSSIMEMSSSLRTTSALSVSLALFNKPWSFRFFTCVCSVHSPLFREAIVGTGVQLNYDGTAVLFRISSDRNILREKLGKYNNKLINAFEYSK